MYEIAVFKSNKKISSKYAKSIKSKILLEGSSSGTAHHHPPELKFPLLLHKQKENMQQDIQPAGQCQYGQNALQMGRKRTISEISSLIFR